ncbi:acyl-CoA dehydrogenase family protein [Streptomyces gamaensis]|uniref:Acyl-CoA dehydrogenase family protein n=1 Tax=Streptomyces gamaensis TaxID=1763542 RepID=A0ABW0YZ82_9ACTN
MDFAFGPEDEALRKEARSWLAARLPAAGSAPEGPVAPVTPVDLRAWERELGSGGWIGLGWDTAHGTYGNRSAGLAGQLVWAEEYARAGAPAARLGHTGEHLLAPTLLAHGDAAQRSRFLPPIARGEELWCQGYSEPGAGSDLAAVRTTAVRSGRTGTYRISGQKTWTSHAHEAHWCFLLARTTPGSRRHHGLSFLLVPLDQPGRVDIRPIRQLTGAADFCDVFLDGAEARAEHLVGAEGDGWRVAVDLLGRERGAATLTRQIGYAAELARVIRLAVDSGAAEDPVLRDRLVRQWAELWTMRRHTLRTLGTDGGPGAAGVTKLLWARWHRALGELAMQVQGPAAALGPGAWHTDRPYELDALQRLFLFSRADTIHSGTDEIQRTVIAERVLGLPKEPRP